MGVGERRPHALDAGSKAMTTHCAACGRVLRRDPIMVNDLPMGPGVRSEGLPSCSFFCEIAEQGYTA